MLAVKVSAKSPTAMAIPIPICGTGSPARIAAERSFAKTMIRCRGRTKIRGYYNQTQVAVYPKNYRTHELCRIAKDLNCVINSF